MCIVSAVYPYPVDSGKRLMLSGFVRHLASKVGPQRLHYVHVTGPGAATGNGDSTEEQPPMVYHQVARPRWQEQLLNGAWYSLLRRRKSLQESLLWGRRTRRRIEDLVRDIDPDVLVYDTVRMAQYIATTPVVSPRRTIIYLDDLFSIRYARMHSTLSRFSDVTLSPLGEFAVNVPRVLRGILSLRRAQRLALRFEGGLVANSEDAAVQTATIALLVNSEEVDVLKRRTGATNVAAVPPLLPERRLARRAYTGRADFVFLGLLTLPHNDVALSAFLSRQMPAVLEALPDARLRIVGRGASEALTELASRYGRNVTLEGYVEDLDEVLLQSCALINPLLFGSGIKLKVLEALARGLPVLSTSVGLEGIVSGSEHGCVLEDDIDAYPGRMASLTHLPTNAALSSAAAEHYDLRYRPTVVRAVYDQVFLGIGGPARDGAVPVLGVSPDG